jgi:hypothetical protein
VLESTHDFIMLNGRGFKARRGNEMSFALEINLALWGMIVCGAMEAAQLFEVF